jgi:uncharacterized protein (TIGR02271 family)
MPNEMLERARPGAAVECLDGRLGSYESVERDINGEPVSVRVRRGWTNHEIRVPVDLVQSVRPDGSVLLSCAKADLDDLARTPRSARSPIHDDEPLPGPREQDDWTRSAPLHEPTPTEWEATLPLMEEELVAHKELREVGAAEIHKQIEEVPGRLEIEAFREEVEVEHVPVGRVVTERIEPYEEDGVLIVPVYEEQLVVTKRLVLREQLRIRRVGTTETHLFEDTLRRERVTVEDPDGTGLVHEQYAEDDGTAPAGDRSERQKTGGFFGFR